MLDQIDRQILALLQENARRPLREIAASVGLTVAPVQRRIARLEKTGVISRYTVQINQGRIATGIEAVTELQFAADLDLAQIMEFVAQIPEVEEVLTLAGDPDAWSASGRWRRASAPGREPHALGWTRRRHQDPRHPREMESVRLTRSAPCTAVLAQPTGALSMVSAA